MNKDISPEERLFNAIQDGKKQPVNTFAKKINDRKGLGGLFEHFKWRRDVAPNPPAKRQGIEVATVNKILIVILGVLVMFVVYDALKEKPRPLTFAAAPALQALSSKPVEEFRPAKAYLEEVKKRDVFHPVLPPPPPPPPPAPKVEPVVVKPNLREMIKDLSLAGVYQGEELEVMIEDKVAKRTYFLKVGDEIRGLKIKTILKDRVIFKLGTDEIELL